MTIIRARQRAITAVSTHSGNDRFLIPSRLRAPPDPPEPPGEFPTARSSNTSEQTTNTQTHNVSMPATVLAGDLLLMVVATANDGSMVHTSLDDLGTWTKVLTQGNVIFNTTSLFAKLADGAEAGQTERVTSNNSSPSTHVSVAIKDWFGTVATGVEVTGANGTTNPPSPTHTVGWAGGLSNYWLVAHANESGQFEQISAYPAGFQQLVQQLTSTGGPNTSVGELIVPVAKDTQAAGTWTLAGTQGSNQFTIAVRPI